MTSMYSQHYENILSILRSAEAEQKKRYDDAIYIDDNVEFRAVTNDARAKIIKVRNLIVKYEDLNNEVLSFFESADEPAPEYGNNPASAIDTSASKCLPVNEEVSKFTFFGKTYPVSDGKNLVEALCEELILRKPYRFLSIRTDEKESDWLTDFVHADKPASSSAFITLSNGFYVNLPSSSNEIVNCCERLLQYCGFGEDYYKII